MELTDIYLDSTVDDGSQYPVIKFGAIFGYPKEIADISDL